jgi:hypothetical protein
MTKRWDAIVFPAAAILHYWAITFGPLNGLGYAVGFLSLSLAAPAVWFLTGGLRELEGRLPLKWSREEFKRKALWRIVVLIVGLYVLSLNDGASCGSNYGELLFSFACEESGIEWHNAIRLGCLYAGHHTVAGLAAYLRKLRSVGIA